MIIGKLRPVLQLRMMMHNIFEVTVVTAFAPRREWTPSIWRQAIDRLGLPIERTKLLVVDNTCGFHKESKAIKQHLRELSSLGYTTQRLVDTTNLDLSWPTTKYDVHKIAVLLSKFWRLFKRYSIGDFVFSLEEDVLPPCGKYQRLKELMCGGIGAVSGVVKSRHCVGPYPMVFDFSSIYPFRHKIPDGLAYKDSMAGKTKNGVQKVGITGLGCLLLKRRALGDVVPRSIADSRTKYPGLEFAMMVDLHKAGWGVLVDWDCLCRHYSTANRWVE